MCAGRNLYKELGNLPQEASWAFRRRDPYVVRLRCYTKHSHNAKPSYDCNESSSTASRGSLPACEAHSMNHETHHTIENLRSTSHLSRFCHSGSIKNIYTYTHTYIFTRNIWLNSRYTHHAWITYSLRGLHTHHLRLQPERLEIHEARSQTRTDSGRSTHANMKQESPGLLTFALDSASPSSSTALDGENTTI